MRIGCGRNALDVAGVKRALNTATAVTGKFDFNRDGRVNALDVALVKQSLTRSLGSVTAGPAGIQFPVPVASANFSAVSILSAAADDLSDVTEPVWDI